MIKKIIGSVVVASALTSGAGAIEVTPFGQVGAIGNFGFGSGNTLPGQSLTGYAGITGHVGVDLNFDGLRLGAGVMTGFAPLTIGAGGDFANNAFVGSHGHLFSKPYVELSDFYVGFQGGGLDFALGRYNASKILATADYVGGYNQGFALGFQSSYFGVWGT